VGIAREKTTRLSQSRSTVVRALQRVQAIRKRNYVEDLAVKSDAGLVTLTQRRKWLLPTFILGLVITALVWIATLSFPQEASIVLSNVSNTKLGLILILLVPFAPPFISLFAMSNLLFPEAPAPEIAVGIMSTFELRQKSNRQYLIVIVSAVFGALNCLFLLMALAEATGN
jgi:hypothetical protein